MPDDTDLNVELRIRQVMAGRLPGLSVAVVRADTIHWLTGLGVADLATQTPATPGTLYLWFSMTKIVTATAVMQLADRGQLSLDDPAAHHYPRFAALRLADRAARVSVRHLLSHSAGLANPIPIRWGAPSRLARPRRLLDRLLSKHSKLGFEPGAKASYSNLGFLVLGQIVEATSGRSVQDYVTST